MKKQMLKLFLTVAMVIMLLPIMASAEEDGAGDGAGTTYPTCCSCGAATCALSGQSGHDLITFDKPFPSGGSVTLQSGNYYLGDNVNPYSVETRDHATVNLYLNGKTLTMNSSEGLEVTFCSTLNIYDNSANEGVITNINGYGDGVDLQQTNSTATLYGGKISGCAGTGVYISRNSGTSFTMEGGTISNNGKDGVYVSSSSTFTMNVGTISGNAWRGVSNGGGTSTMKAGTTICDNVRGGVDITGGTFTMEGGTISGNTADYGGGVNIRGGTFIMEDGIIRDNMAKEDGGGVYISGGTFTMEGGTITGNTSNLGDTAYNDAQNHGGGVYFSGGTFNLSDGIITGNYRDSTVNNVYIDDDSTGEINVVNGTLSDRTKIGVTSDNKPTPDRPVAITDSCSADYSKHFFSDDAAQYHIENGADNTVVLAKGVTTYTVTWVVDGVGTTEMYGYGETPTFKGSTDKAEDAQYTYTFDGWDSKIVSVDGDKTYTATYTSIPKEYAVSVNASEGGAVSGGGNYAYNTSVTITVDPDDGYVVDDIKVYKTDDENTTITVTGNQFTMPAYAVTISVTFKSSTVPVTGVSLDETNIALTVGDTKTLIATVEPAAATNKAVTWSSSDNTVAAVDSNGKVTAVAPGTATITATAADGSGKNSTCVVTVNAVTYTITKADTENGTVTVDKTTAADGETVTITATPANGYVVDTVAYTPDSGSATAITPEGGVYSFTMPAANVTVSVTFKKIPAPVISGGDDSSPSNTTSKTEKNEDGSTTTTTTNQATGTVTETTRATDGTTGTTVTDKNGKVTEVSAKVPAAAANAAEKAGKPVAVPVEVPAAKSSEEAAPIKVDVPTGGAAVEIPVENVTPGTVVVIVAKDGTEQVVRTSSVSETGVVVKLESDATVKVVDMSRDFKDVHPVNHWATDAIDFVAARGIFNGTSTDTFTPNGSMTRQAMWMTLARMSGEEPADMAAARDWAVENEVSDGTNPLGTVTRQQYVAMLWRWAAAEGMDVSGGEETNILSYTDADKISDYAVEAFQWACSEGIVGGYDDGTLRALTNASRAHAAAMMMRFCASAVK